MEIENEHPKSEGACSWASYKMVSNRNGIIQIKTYSFESVVDEDEDMLCDAYLEK